MRSVIVFLVGMAAGTLLAGGALAWRDAPSALRARAEAAERDLAEANATMNRQYAMVDEALSRSEQIVADTSSEVEEHKLARVAAMLESSEWEHRASQVNVALALVLWEQGTRPIRSALLAKAGAEELGPWFFTGSAIDLYGVRWLLSDELGLDEELVDDYQAVIDSAVARVKARKEALAAGAGE